MHIQDDQANLDYQVTAVYPEYHAQQIVQTTWAVHLIRG